MKKNLLCRAGISMMLALLFGACSKEQILEKTALSNKISAGFAVIDVEKFKQEQTARLIEESPRTHLLNIISTHQSYFHSRFSLKEVL